MRGFVIDLSPLKRSRDFRLLWLGQFVSEIGSEVTLVAVPFQVFQITHSTLAVGMLALCELFPLLTLSVVGGALADAVDRRKLLLWTHAALTVGSLALALNARPSLQHLWVLYAFATLTAGLYGLYSPGLRSLVPRLIPLDLLPSAIALTSAYGSFGFLLGPILGGVLIGTIGLAGSYLFDVATFVIALVALAAMAPVPPHHEAPPFSLRAIREGLRFLKGRRVLQTAFTMDLNAMIFGMPEALFPAIAVRLGGGPQVLGLLIAAPHFGSFLVNLFSGRAKRVRRQGLAVVLAVIVWGGAIVGFGLSNVLWLSLAFLAVAGGGDMWSGIFRTTILQSITPDAMRGRLEGIGMAVWTTGPSLGNVEAGVAGALVGVPFAVVSGGLACIVGAVVLTAVNKEFVAYDAGALTPEPD
jgi:MFS family permease